MLRKIPALIGCIVLALACAACSRTENKPPEAPNVSSTGSPKPVPDAEPPADVVRVSAPEVQLPAGGAAEASVSVQIAKGYHINGNPASKFQIATTLDVAKDEGITISKPVYPAAMTKKFSFSDEPITVYEGEAVIKQSLRAAANATKGARVLRGKLKVQPCDDHVCYPPRTLDVSLPIVVK
jgi:hypothetical protein